MKRFLTLAIAAAVAGSVTAQEVTVVEHEGYDELSAPSGTRNWFISAGAGPQIFFGDHDRQRQFGQRISPALDVAVGKWFTPMIGARLMYSGLYFNGATQNGAFQSGGPISGKPWDGYWLSESKVNFMNLHADVMFDLCNLIGGYNPGRVYSLAFYAGVGLGYTWDRASAADHKHKQGITGNLGFFNMFHVSKAIDLNIDLRAMAVDDNFDGDGGNRPFDGLIAVTAGITYRFAPRGWKASREIVTVYDNDAVNELRAKVQALVAENEKLEREASKTTTRDVTREVVRVVGSNYLIYFPINVSSLSLADRAQLDMCAKAIKESDSSVRYKIVGYADKATGNPQINEILSRSRAESVRDCLVNEFGIPASRFEVSWRGGVGNMFYDEPALSRIVIITTIK